MLYFKIKYKYGTIYEGYWHNNMAHGYGRFIDEVGAYEGEY